MIVYSLDEALEHDLKDMFKNPVVIPTETVYGLAARIDDEDSLNKIFEIKGRPKDNPLILHISSMSMLENLLDCDIPNEYKKLLNKYWPGPLTCLFKGKNCLSSIIRGNSSEYIAVRMPNKDKLRTLIEKLGVPLAAPSANTSGKPSPTTVQHVIDDLGGKVDFYIDDGPCELGLESTVFGFINGNPILLRPGAVTLEQLEKDLDCKIDVKTKSNGAEPVLSPGQKYKHYSPNVPVHLFKCANWMEKMRIYAKNFSNKKIGVMCSSNTGFTLDQSEIYEMGKDTKTWSKNVYKALIDLDKKCDLIFIQSISNENEGRAVMDRIEKASSFIIE